MKYISTRGQADPVDFVDACLTGLAPDGGLYVPETWPQIALAAPNESYVDVATRVLSAFVGEALSEAERLYSQLLRCAPKILQDLAAERERRSPVARLEREKLDAEYGGDRQAWATLLAPSAWLERGVVGSQGVWGEGRGR